MPETFGARLRQRREEQNIALVTIADQTKIKLSLLEALERDDVSHWPSGIFRRAYIRAYAHAIGLSPDVVVREVLEVHPEPVEVVATEAPMAPADHGARMSSGPPTRLRCLVDSALGSLSRLRRGPAVDAPPGFTGPPLNTSAGSGLQPPARPSPEPVEDERARAVVADHQRANEPAAYEPDFLAVAHLCTDLGRAASADEVQPLLREAARILDATGLIVWMWDDSAAVLRPALVHGYSDRIVAQLPVVRCDADNGTAAAFRSGQTCVIDGSDRVTGALVVPLLTPAGCAGVLALELQHGGERAKSVRAAATLFAALLAQLTGGATAR